MLHRELKINYGTLEELIIDIESYQSALSTMKQNVKRIWELVEESSGEAYESLEERKETILGQISTCEEELTDLHELLAGYSYDMQNVIAPVYRDRTMVVDRNDIWFNMQSILRACDRIAAMVYNVNVPWFGTTYTAFAEDEVKKKETKYYNRLEEVREKIQRKYQDSIAGYKDELVKLYENKVVVYENTDDVYASKVSRDYYPKYTSPGEEVVNILEWLGDAITGFTGGVMEGVIGVIDGIGEFLFGIGEFAISECVVLVNEGMGSESPDWAVKNVEETKAQIGAILDEPMLLIEGMAQGVSDTYESEGIWYCTGYAVGTYAGTKGIAEVGKEVKGKVGVKGKVEESDRKYSGELMTLEESARYSEHWRQLGIGSDKTWNEFIKANPNKTIDDYLRIVQEQSPWPDGYKFEEHCIKLKSGDTFNMVLDLKQKTSQPGGFALKEDIPSVEFARNEMAIKYGWKDDCGKAATYRVKDGVELLVPSGPIGPQIDLAVDKYLSGNNSLTQYNLFYRLNNVNRNDYIELVPGSVRRLR